MYNINVVIQEDIYAGMAELADALDSGSSESNFMEVQVLLPAPSSRNPSPKPVGEGFGFLYVFEENGCSGDMCCQSTVVAITPEHRPSNYA